MVKAVIFDLDGLLIDSEPLWREAERKVFEKVGIVLEDGDFEHFTGYKIAEVVAFWFAHKPWTGFSQAAITNAILDELEFLIDSKGKAKAGVAYILEFLAEKKLPMVVASSSPMRIIEKAIQKLHIDHYFKALYSAEFEAYGKPHPGVFLTAVAELGYAANECLVFEDSFNGLIAAKAARTKTVSVPESHLFEQNRFDIADFKLASLAHFNENHLSAL